MKLSFSLLDIDANIMNWTNLYTYKFSIHVGNFYTKEESKAGRGEEFSVLRLERLNLGWDVEVCGFKVVQSF
jgi:hypothetical protein